jgi:hypothetical protein
MIALTYRTRGLIRRAKQLLRAGTDFKILLEGWRAKFLWRRVFMLQRMAQISAGNDAGPQPPSLGYDFLRLAVALSRFMVVFFLSVTGGRRVEFRHLDSGDVEASFLTARTGSPSAESSSRN